jgi:hypothetical protein
MLGNTQEEYYRKVDEAVQLAYDLLTKHNLRPQKYRVHIRSMGYSTPTEPHSLTISTADGSVWVTETQFPFRCLEEMDPFGGDAFSSIVSDRVRELVKKVRHSGRPL